MVELNLNGTIVVLPINFSDSFIDENSILTKNGEYTLDLEISLLNPTNAKFFKHINRFNVSRTQPISSAILIVDNIVRLNGIAKIIRITDTAIFIQLLSGNSALNYICNDKLLLSDFDFGTAPEVTLEIAVDSILSTWPTRNFVCARNTIANNLYNDIYRRSDEEIPTITLWYEGLFCKYNIQPYVMYYFTEIIAKLGYRITYNVLETDAFFKRLILFSGKASLNYNDLLPPWTIIKFLEQIEKLANVVYVIDKIDKTIRILRTKTHYETAITHYIPDDDCIDLYDSESDENDYSFLNYTKVKYNLEAIEYYKYQSLSDDVLKTATIETYANFASLLASYSTNDLRHEAYQTLKIFKVSDSRNYYIISDMDYGINFYFKRVNLFKEINEGAESDSYVEFDIIPVEIRNYVGSVNEIAENEEVVTDINTVILNDLSTPDKNDLMYVGFNLGIPKIGPGYNTGYLDFYQITITDCYKLLDNLAPEELIEDESLRLSLSFNSLFGPKVRYYADNLNIDNLYKWTMTFRWKSEYDVRNYFVFHGKKFYCEKIETKGDRDFNGGFVDGKFYGTNELI